MLMVEALIQDIESLTPLTFSLVLLAGLIVGVAPSSFPLLAVSAGLGTGKGSADAGQGKLRGFWLATGFALGVATVDALLGALFGFAGLAVLSVLNSAMAYVYALLSTVLLVTGLALWRVVGIPIRLLSPKERPAKTFVGAFALGIPFGLSTCPACTPLLLPVVIAAASTGDPVLGAVLMGGFGIARGIPIVLAGTTAASLANKKNTGNFTLWAERIGGGLLVAAALYFAWQAAIYAGWTG